jgi:hypothetical protein
VLLESLPLRSLPDRAKGLIGGTKGGLSDILGCRPTPLVSGSAVADLVLVMTGAVRGLGTGKRRPEVSKEYVA